MKITNLALVLSVLFAQSILAEVSDQQLFREVRPVRIMKIELYDQGKISEGQHDVAIDTAQNICIAGEEETPEPFYDTLAGIYVYNKSNTSVNIQKVRFIIRNLNQKRYRSQKLSLASVGYVDSGSTKRVLALLLHATNGAKFLHPFIGPLPQEPGSTNVKFILTGRNQLGRRVKTVGKIALVFRDLLRCQ